MVVVLAWTLWRAPLPLAPFEARQLLNYLIVFLVWDGGLIGAFQGFFLGEVVGWLGLVIAVGRERRRNGETAAPAAPPQRGNTPPPPPSDPS